MVDVDTFLTILYVMVDDFCQSRPQTEQHPGPDASLSPSEVLTLAIFARWARFGSERDFYRYANTRLRDAFPTLPHRSQFNCCVREHLDLRLPSHRGGESELKVLASSRKDAEPGPGSP